MTEMAESAALTVQCVQAEQQAAGNATAEC